jgi:hypothetical protein
MGSSYAGILGPIAFVSMLARGIVGGSSTDSVLLSSTVCLIAFAAIGYVIGRLADQTVLESVKQRFDREIKAREKAAPGTPRTQTSAAGE